MLSTIHTHGSNTSKTIFKKERTTMALTRVLTTLTDRPTIVLPPVSDGPFQGWGTRIG
jgi:hypothetical protein